MLYHLNQTSIEEIVNILRKYAEVISYSFKDVRPSIVAVTHRFELTSNNPMYQKARRMSRMHNEIVHEEVDRMLAAGIMTPVESPWTSPVVIATKKDGFPRFCVDYRNLNSATHADRWPLPRVDEISYDMNGNRVFITIDLFQGYWLIKMDQACKEKAAFICRYGTLQFEVMPFGLMNSQATFQ